MPMLQRSGGPPVAGGPSISRAGASRGNCPAVAGGTGDPSLMYEAIFVLCGQRQPRDC